VNLLLRFFESEQGTIRIDGQDIDEVTQESLRAAIGMVTQDTRCCIARSPPISATAARRKRSQVEPPRARRRRTSSSSVCSDWTGRTGYDAHVGERGVKLSGGSASGSRSPRVVLKDAPILVLDEATSALDSEVELAIQEQLLGLMEGKTVIAIAHRLVHHRAHGSADRARGGAASSKKVRTRSCSHAAATTKSSGAISPVDSSP
jgi:ATP-binding cassette subfamily B multidrug efflux pump